MRKDIHQGDLSDLADVMTALEDKAKEMEGKSVADRAALLNYEQQLRNLQEISLEKIKAKEEKIAERMNKLQKRFNGLRG
ncbi:MAG: hypothetical protein DI539_05875 [Flavobacterium psychrophilum]|nr:MAG: hypothetical protein DI539_05875 [Flavobacterium psychrophilum]